jgi:hypothetical protein
MILSHAEIFAVQQVPASEAVEIGVFYLSGNLGLSKLESI